MLFTIISTIFIAIGVYSITLLAIDEYKKNKKNKVEVTNEIKDATIKVEFKKDKTAFGYFLLVIICLVCIYSARLSNLFLPLFKKVYYGNLNGMFLAVASIIIWIFELVAVYFIAKNFFNIDLFSKRKKDTKKISLLNMAIIFLLTFLPIMLISWLLGWNLKIVDDFGQKIENIKVTSVVSQYVLYLLKILWTTIIISLAQEGVEKMIKTKIQIPWGGIILMLTFGILEIFFFDGKFKLIYFIFNFIFGLIYLLSNKKFAVTYWTSYVLYLL